MDSPLIFLLSTMFRSLFFILAAISLPCTAIAQANVWNKLYVGANLGIQADQTINSGVTVSSAAFYPNVDKAAYGIGYNGSLRIGYMLSPVFFVESGFGVYAVTQSLNVHSASLSTEYKNVHLRASWSYIPVKLGINLPARGRWSVAALAGCNLLVDRNTNGSILADDHPQVLEAKRGKAGMPAANAYAYVLANDYDFFSVLFTSGLRANYAINKRLGVYTELNLVLGMRPMQSAVMFLFEDNITSTVQAHSFSATKGDALGLSFGMTYKIGD